jgi:geranylgeranyl diphosphate/geranylgeranyl-bacteriochlorophyllide a reductase
LKEAIEMLDHDMFDVVVVGGGPSGATAAADLARNGRKVMLLDKAGRIKPCGGAIPPAAIAEFAIPDDMLVAKVTSARMISPKGVEVDMPIDGGFVGMVDREHFDEWLRARAAMLGATRVTGAFDHITRDSAGYAIVHYSVSGADGEKKPHAVRTRLVIGADGASSKVARQEIDAAADTNYVYAYHEIVRSPKTDAGGSNGKFDAKRCDVYYQGPVSPDFYGWVFPHGETTSVGMGTAQKGFSIRNATAGLRKAAGLGDAETVRREGAPIPMKPLKRWDNARDVVLAGDAAGVVAPASGEGIYYAMVGGRLAADAAQLFLTTSHASALATARKRFMKAHGRVFWILGMMQKFWYSSDKRRERFVSICRDKDVQELTWQAYMHKKLVRAKPMAHIRIFFKDLAHLAGFARL